MWRASLEILDFLPFSTVDYSGGMIITDWYSDDNNADIRYYAYNVIHIILYISILILIYLQNNSY